MEFSAADITGLVNSGVSLTNSFLTFGADINRANNLGVSSPNSGDPVVITVPGITPQPQSSGLSTGAWVAIGVGGMLFLALLIFIAFKASK